MSDKRRRLGKLDLKASPVQAEGVPFSKEGIVAGME